MAIQAILYHPEMVVVKVPLGRQKKRPLMGAESSSAEDQLLLLHRDLRRFSFIGKA